MCFSSVPCFHSAMTTTPTMTTTTMARKEDSDKQETCAGENYRNASLKYWLIESRPRRPCPPNIGGIQTQWRPRRSRFPASTGGPARKYFPPNTGAFRAGIPASSGAADESSVNDRTSGKTMHRATAAVARREQPV